MPEPQVFDTPQAMTEWAVEVGRRDMTLGFVPTMGALHEAHASLIGRAKQENDAVAVSIFVNPTQFGPGEDFAKYPRPFEADLALCEEHEVDAVFAPSPEAMYDRDLRTWVEVGGLADNLCGLSRPGHFRGVATVVAKLLSIVRPDRAYFGRKDAQQLRIVEVMVRDLNLGCEVVGCPIVRDPDGVAVSSRNRYLSVEERKQARCLNQALQLCERKVDDGERNAIKLIEAMTNLVQEQPDAEVDYIALVNAETMQDLEILEGNVLCALAVKIGTTRLIDNTTFEIAPE